MDNCKVLIWDLIKELIHNLTDDQIQDLQFSLTIKSIHLRPYMVLNLEFPDPLKKKILVSYLGEKHNVII